MTRWTLSLRAIGRTMALAAFLPTVLLLLVADARAVIIYDLEITDTGGGLSGSGSLTFADDAFDSDGIFDLFGALHDASITTNGTDTGESTTSAKSSWTST